MSQKSQPSDSSLCTLCGTVKCAKRGTCSVSSCPSYAAGRQRLALEPCSLEEVGKGKL